jgi:hypothetical protein
MNDATRQSQEIVTLTLQYSNHHAGDLDARNMADATEHAIIDASEAAAFLDDCLEVTTKTVTMTAEDWDAWLEGYQVVLSHVTLDYYDAHYDDTGGLIDESELAIVDIETRTGMVLTGTLAETVLVARSPEQRQTLEEGYNIDAYMNLDALKAHR